MNRRIKTYKIKLKYAEQMLHDHFTEIGRLDGIKFLKEYYPELGLKGLNTAYNNWQLNKR